MQHADPGQASSFFKGALGFGGLGFRGLGFRGLGFRGLGFRGFGFRKLHVPQGVTLGSSTPKSAQWNTEQLGSFRKLGVPYFGVLIIRILLFGVLS